MTSMLMMFDGGSVALSGGGGGGVVITTGYGRIDRLMGGGGVNMIYGSHHRQNGSK